MLRRKLMVVLGSLVLLLLAAAVSAILLLGAVVEEMNRHSAGVLRFTTCTIDLDAVLADVDRELAVIGRRPDRTLDALIEPMDRLEDRVATILELEPLSDEAAAAMARLGELEPVLRTHVQRLATARDAERMNAEAVNARQTASEMRLAATRAAREAQRLIQDDQARIASRLRLTVIGMGLVFIVVINVSIIVLLRAATMVLQPVNTLVEASRRLAREEFDHRVPTNYRDEFGEMARAMNGLAAELQANEERKIETLRQVATALSHELNNAMAVIDLQLAMLARSSGGSLEQAERLRQIQAMLDRMAHTVDALKRVRRIVLTDYIGGVQMLDLERSSEETEATTAAHGAGGS